MGMLVLHGQDVDLVARAIAIAIDGDASTTALVLRSWLRTTRLAEAKNRWLKHRHLPKQVSQRWVRAGEPFPPGTWSRCGEWFRRVDRPPAQYIQPVDKPLDDDDHALLWTLIRRLDRRYHVAVLCNSWEQTDVFHDGRCWRFWNDGERDGVSLAGRCPRVWQTADGLTWRVGEVRVGKANRLILELGHNFDP